MKSLFLLLCATSLLFAGLTPYSGTLERPVVFVHGLGAQKNYWKIKEFNVYGFKFTQVEKGSAVASLAKYYNLPTSDYNRIINIFKPSGFEFFNGSKAKNGLNEAEVQSQELYSFLIEVLDIYYSDWRVNPNAQIDLIGHSQGGIDIREAIKNNRNTGLENPINHIHSIITANTPHEGTYLATKNGGKYQSVDDLRDDLDWLSDRGYMDIVSDVKDLYSDIIKNSSHLAVNSKFIKNLNEVGYPSLPRTNQKIPMVALYGNAPSLGEIILDQSEAQSEIACKIKDIEVNSSEYVDYDCESWWPGTQWACSAGEYSTEKIVNAVGDVAEFTVDVGLSIGASINDRTLKTYTIEEASSWICRQGVDLTFEAFDIHYFSWLDQDWFNESDGVVDVTSQKGESIFSESRDPFVTLNENVIANQNIVPHLDLFGVKGPESMGNAFIKAIEVMPEMPSVNVVPQTFLLLN